MTNPNPLDDDFEWELARLRHPAGQQQRHQETPEDDDLTAICKAAGVLIPGGCPPHRKPPHTPPTPSTITYYFISLGAIITAMALTITLLALNL
ncbi:MAG: hypothetical protein Q4A82_00970 [Corynebacterium sp.]|nr:hypothetical protein [Corynebacterium sp.]